MPRHIPRRSPAPTQPTPTPPAPPAPDPLTDDELPAADALSTMLAELAGSSDESNVTVYRDGKNQELGYLFKCAPEAFSLDDLRDKYGGGRFRLFITRNGTLYRNRVVIVEPPMQREAMPAASVDIAAVIREGFAAQAEALAKVVARPLPSLLQGANLPEVITAAAGALTALRALFPAPPPPAPAPAVENESRAVDRFIKAFELARDLQAKGGGAGDDDGGGVMGIVRELIRSPIIGQAMAAAASAPRAAPAVVPKPAQPAAVTHQPQPASEPEPEADPMAQYVALLCDCADKGADVSLYADLIVDRAPDALLRPLLAQLDPLAELESRYPQITERRAWFNELVDELRRSLAEVDAHQNEGEGEGDAVPPVGNVGEVVIQTAPANPPPTRRGAGALAKKPHAPKRAASNVPREHSSR
jgi:hypothetical protein